jgi:hypothetical protein
MRVLQPTPRTQMLKRIFGVVKDWISELLEEPRSNKPVR